MFIIYEELSKFSEKLNIPRKPFALRTCAARCLLLYLSTASQPIGVFVSGRVFRFVAVFFTPFACVSANIEMADVKEQFALNFASSSTELQLKPTEC
jgi:hypothetical protein